MPVKPDQSALERPAIGRQTVNQRRVAVIVLNWNGCSHSISCLRSLKWNVESGLVRIVIVDNASTDDSVERMRGWFNENNCAFVELREPEKGVLCEEGGGIDAHYALIRASRNGGYAAGNNLGIQFALQ